jgi:hypothetical protein
MESPTISPDGCCSLERLSFLPLSGRSRQGNEGLLLFQSTLPRCLELCLTRLKHGGTEGGLCGQGALRLLGREWLAGKRAGAGLCISSTTHAPGDLEPPTRLCTSLFSHLQHRAVPPCRVALRISELISPGAESQCEPWAPFYSPYKVH